MKYKQFIYVFQGIVGIILLFIGSIVLTSDEEKMVSGLCFGLGSALLVLGIGWFIQTIIFTPLEYEEVKRLKAIEVNDERNIKIREKTGYMVAKIMNYVILTFILALGYIGADKLIIILAISLIVIEFILLLIFSNYFAKKI